MATDPNASWAPTAGVAGYPPAAGYPAAATGGYPAAGQPGGYPGAQPGVVAPHGAVPPHGAAIPGAPPGHGAIAVSFGPSFPPALLDFPLESDVLVLNVGGTLFSTTKQTLQSCPGSLLSEKFSDENLKKLSSSPSSTAASSSSTSPAPSTTPSSSSATPSATPKPSEASATTSKRVIFLDRNPAAFERVLTFLRTGKLLLPRRSELSDKEILEEFNYWRISPKMMSLVDSQPTTRLADQVRQKTVGAIMRESSVYIDHFLHYAMAEIELASSQGKTEQHFVFGSPPAAKKGKPISDTNLHKWLTLRRSHLTLLKHTLSKEGFDVTLETGLPNSEWIYIVLKWPFAVDAVPGSFTFE